MTEQGAPSGAATDAPRRVPFDTILDLLRSPKDEEKFVGTQEAAGSDDVNLLHIAREAVGLSFIDRLLKTEGYRALAVSMLATFSGEPAFASSSDLLSRLPPMLSLLCTPGADPSEAVDAFRCVMAVVAAQPAAVASDGLLVPLARAAAVATGDRQLDLLNAVMTVCATSTSQPSPAADGALRALFPSLTLLLARRDAGAGTFTVLQTLVTLLDALAEDEWLTSALSFPQSLRDETSAALLALLSSKLGASQRALALLVVAHCVRAFGLRWAGNKLGPLSAQLARAELEVALHYSSTAAPPAERTRVVSSCAHLLEVLIDSLVDASQSDADTGLSPDVLLSYRAPLGESASTILSYFETQPADPVPLKVTVMRPLAAWLAELDDLPAGVEAALPQLLSLPDEALPFLLPVYTVAATSPLLSPILRDHHLPSRLVSFLAPQFPSLLASAKHAPAARRALSSASACIAALADGNPSVSRTMEPLLTELENAATQLRGTDAEEDIAAAVGALRAHKTGNTAY